MDLTILDPDLNSEAVYPKRFVDEFSRIINSWEMKHYVKDFPI